MQPFTFLIFLAFIPIFFIIDKAKRSTFFVFLATLIFNALTTWWIWNSTDVGSVAAIVANSVLMCVPIIGYKKTKQYFGKIQSYIAFVSWWMLFEYIHLNWQLSWPWLSLGNVFASSIKTVQWYQYTGIAGGTLWILVINILLKEIVDFYIKNSRIHFKLSALVVFILVVPITFSYYLFNKENKQPTANIKVLIIQPNIDPYLKFDASNTASQIQQLLTLSQQNLDTATTLIVWPETALSSATWQNEIRSNSFYTPIFNFLESHPKVSILTGIETLKYYGTTKATATARKANDGSYYDVFNTAMLLHHNAPIELYNKSKLVPGVESMPTFLNFLAPVFEQFGGTTGGYGISDSSAVFKISPNVSVDPVICYESIYGDYVSSSIKKGANLTAIITNDGWWGNTPGHKQHLAYASLRAIETRKYIVRSANTGISAVIDNKGQIIQQLGWAKEGVLLATIPIYKGSTFYVVQGDYLYLLFSISGILLLVLFFYKLIMKRIAK